ncbi:MAG: immunoglobulin domain-containing protein [Opitutaceae bacterium]
MSRPSGKSSATARPMAWLGPCVRFALLALLFQAAAARASYTLNWQNNDTSGDETGFSIERSDSGGAFVQIATVPASVTTYQDTSTSNGVIYAYRVCSYNSNGNSGYTNVVTNAPAITTQPAASQAVTAGGTATFTVAATGLPPPSYQWQLNGSNLTDGGNIYGSSTATLTVTNVSEANAGSYTVVVSNGLLPNPVSNAETLSVSQASQTISFSSIPSVAYGAAAFTLNASASSGLSVSYSSSNTSVATVSGSTVTIVGVGSTTITASQAGNSSYSAAPSVGQVFTVTQAAQAINFASISPVAYGAAPFYLSATASSGLSVSYSSSNTSVATVSGSTVTIVGVGSTTITASQAGNSSYSAAPSVGQILTVTQAAQAINFPSISPVAYGAAPFYLSAAASSGLAVSYTSSNTSVATVSGSTVTIVGVGSTTITASQAGNSIYSAAPNASQTLTVTQAVQTIAFPAIAAAKYGAAPFTLGATASSGLAVSYSSSNTSVATVSGGTVTIVGAGSATITASQAGNSDYSAATSVTQTLTVSQASQTINFGAIPNQSPGAAPFALGATASSGLPVSYASSNSGVATVSGSTVTIVGAGNTTITASQSGNADYLAATSVPQSLTVTPATGVAQTITFPAISSVAYGAAPFALGATSTSGLTVSYTSSNTNVATIIGNMVTIVGVGSTTITASQGGNSTYAAATSVTQTLTVNSASQTITFPAISAVTFGASPITLSATASSGLNVSYSSSNTSVATVNGSTVTIVGAGSATITASQAGNSYYSAATSVAQTLTVNKAPQTITFSAISAVTFGAAPLTLSATATSGLAVSFTSSNSSVATVNGSTVTIVGAGSATITANQAGNSNYSAATGVTQTLTVNSKSQTITFPAISAVTFGAAPLALGATASSGLAVSYTSSNTSVATIAGSTVTIVGAGTATITASQAGNTNYGAATSVTQTLTVNKASQTITFPAISSVGYGAAPFNLTATAGAGMSVSYTSSNTSVATINGSTVTIVGMGSTTITASQAGNANYNAATSVTQTLTVTKATQTITFGAIPTQSVGEAPFILSATASSGLPVTYTSSNTSVATVNGGTVSVVGKGSSTITASQAGNADYQAATSVSQTLTVTQVTLASQTITFPAIPAVTYGASPITLGATSSSGLPVSYTVLYTSVATVSGSTATIVGVGTTTITATQAGNSTYSAAPSVTQSLTVNKASQTIAFDAIPSQAIGSAPFTLGASASSGLPLTYTSSNKAVATVSGSTVTIVGKGTSTITASQSGNANYLAATSVSQTLTVGTTSLASQTITFPALSPMKMGADPLTLAATASSGLPVSYASSNTSVATINGSTLTVVGIGTSTITASQAGNATYSAAPSVAQTLTVSQGTQTIAFAPITALLVNTPYTLNATASSGLPVTFTLISGNASITGNWLTVFDTNPVTVQASQAGNASYSAAPSVSQTASASLPQFYFGQFGTGNSMAAASGNNLAAFIAGSSGTLIGYIASAQDAFVLNFTLSNSSFSAQTVSIPPPGTPAQTLTFSGTLSNGVLSGTIQELGLSFSAVVDPSSGASASLAGLYSAGGTYAIVGTQNEIFTLALVPNQPPAAGLGTVDGDGSFSVQTSQGATVSGTVTGNDFSVQAPQIGSAPAAISGTVSLLSGGTMNYSSGAGLSAPQIQPSSQSVSAGTNVTLSVIATGATGYQWQFEGANIAGATNSTLSMPSIGTYQAGAYTVQVTTSSGTVSSDPATVAVNVDAHLINLSARAFVGTGSQVLVAGFVDTGSTPLQLLVRGDGPALSAFDVSGVLPDPTLSLFDSSSVVIGTDTGWGNSIIPGSSTSGVTVQPATSEIFSEVYAFPLIANSLDSALVANVPAGGAFTAQVSGLGGATGVGLIELYDTALGAGPSYLSNISARALVGSGSNVAVVGFSVYGTTSTTVLLRGIGPTLSQYGVTGTLSSPQLVLYDSNQLVIATNTGWGNAPQPGLSTVLAGIGQATAQIMSSVYAFSLPANSADCAMVVTLPPGTYTVQLSGLNGSTGVGLVEAYNLP